MTTRAVVLGGGGLVGVAWESGLLAGLSESGVNFALADLIVRTSAGSFVRAELAMGRSPSSIVEGILAEDPARILSAGGKPMKVPDMSLLFAKMAEAVSGARPAEQVRAEIGAWALSAETMMSEKEFIAGFGRSFSGLPEDFWPERPYTCTAVDAADGSFVLWNKESGVGLVRAVASSCGAPGVFPPITIRGRRYIDGGMRSPTNADAAKATTWLLCSRYAGQESIPLWRGLSARARPRTRCPAQQRSTSGADRSRSRQRKSVRAEPDGSEQAKRRGDRRSRARQGLGGSPTRVLERTLVPKRVLPPAKRGF